MYKFLIWRKYLVLLNTKHSAIITEACYKMITLYFTFVYKVSFHESVGMGSVRLVLPYDGLPRWLSSKESACNAGNVGLSPGSGRFPGGGRSNSFQYSCL